MGPAVSSVIGKAHKPGSGPCKFCLALEKLLPATTLLTTLGGLVPPFAQASPFPAAPGGKFVLTQRLSPDQRCSLLVGCRWWEWECAAARSRAG